MARKLFHPESGDADWLEEREFSRFEAWVDVLQMTAWAPRRQGDAQLSRGEFVASLRTLSKRWKWSIKKVRLWLAEAQKSGKIRGTDTPEKGHIQGHALGHTKGHRAGTVYLIVNYDRYQSGEPQKGTDEGTPKGTPKGTLPPEKGHKKESSKAVTTTTLDENGDSFEVVWADYPQRAGGNPKAAAKAAWDQRVREGCSPAALLAAVRAYKAFLAATGKIGTEFVMQGATFFGTRKRGFEQDWTPPAVVPKGDLQARVLELQRVSAEDDARDAEWIAQRRARVAS